MATVKVLTITSAADAPTFTVEGFTNTVFVRITGTWGASIIFQVSRDKGATYDTVTVFQFSTSTPVTVATINDVYGIDTAGVDIVKITTSVFAFGTVTLTISRSAMEMTVFPSSSTVTSTGVTGAGTTGIPSTTSAFIQNTIIIGLLERILIVLMDMRQNEAINLDQLGRTGVLITPIT